MEKWIKRGVVPAIMFLLLMYVFKTVYTENGVIDWFRLWMILGIPFGMTRICIWILPRGYDIGGTVGMLALSLILSGVIGGVIAAITMVQAVYYLITFPVQMMRRT